MRRAGGRLLGRLASSSGAAPWGGGLPLVHESAAMAGMAAAPGALGAGVQARSLFGWGRGAGTPRDPPSPSPSTPVSSSDRAGLEMHEASAPPPHPSASSMSASPLNPVDADFQADYLAAAGDSALSSSSLSAALSSSSLPSVDRVIELVDPWWFTRIMMRAVDGVHGALGVEWWAAIAMCTVLFRGMMYPGFAWQQRSSWRMQQMKPAADMLREIQEAMLAKRVKVTPELASALRNQVMRHAQATNAAGFLGGSVLLVFVQMPLFIGMYRGIDHLCTHMPQLRGGGLLWFPDLAAPDPWYVVLPVLSVFFQALAMETTPGEMGKVTPEEQRRNAAALAGGRVPVALAPLASVPARLANDVPRYREFLATRDAGVLVTKDYFRALMLVFTCISTQFEAGLLVYWTASGVFSVTQNLYYMHPSTMARNGLKSKDGELRRICLEIQNELQPLLNATGSSESPKEGGGGKRGRGDRQVGQVRRQQNEGKGNRRPPPSTVGRGLPPLGSAKPVVDIKGLPSFKAAMKGASSSSSS